VDLNHIGNVRKNFEEVFSDPEKAAYREGAAKIKALFEEEFPALVDIDRAAVAWYVSRTLAAIADTKVRILSDTIMDGSVIYAVVADDLLFGDVA
jgi:hypothetical protein